MAEHAPADQHVRHVLEEVAAGRMLVEEAAAETDNGRSSRLLLQGVVGIPQTNIHTYRFVSLMILLFATMIGSVGGFFGWRTLRFEIYGRTVEGRVVRMVHGGGSGNHTKPVVEYVVDGKRHEVTGIISSSPSTYSVRDKAIVHYIPEDPADAQVSGFVERWLFLLIFGGLGVALGCVALAFSRVREVPRSLPSP